MIMIAKFFYIIDPDEYTLKTDISSGSRMFDAVKISYVADPDENSLKINISSGSTKFVTASLHRHRWNKNHFCLC